MKYKYLILFVFILGFIFLKNNIYFPLADIGREFYIPTEMANGKILYKDIFCVYPPLGYYLNALFVKIFSNSLNVFYSISFVLSLITLAAVYFISKIYTNKLMSFFITVFIMVSCTFYPSISNWITPYSYSIMYALASILWSFYFITKYIENKKNSYLYLSCFLYGLSLCCKYEYIFFGFVIIYVLIKQKALIKDYLKSFLYFFVFPVICIFVMLFQNVDFVQTIKYAISLSNSSSVKYFYEYSGITINLHSIKSAILSLMQPGFSKLFYPLSLISVVTIFFIKKTDLKLIVLNIAAILLSFKVIGGISFEIYGTYFFPILFILIVSMLYKKVPQKILVGIISLLIIFYTGFIIKNNNLEEIRTSKGIIKVEKIFKEPIQKLIDYDFALNDDKLLVLPEGVILNYFNNKASDDYLFYLIPPNVELFGEEFIIERIKNNGYKYIVIHNQMYNWFNEISFMRSWGKNVYAYIKSKYSLKEVIGEGFKFYVYEIDNRKN